MVIGLVVWVRWVVVCLSFVYIGVTMFCNLRRMVRHLGSRPSSSCWLHIWGVGPWVIMSA